MRAYLKSCIILTFLFSFFFPVILSEGNATTRPTISVSNKGLLNRIISITAKDMKNGTIVNVLGNGRIIDFVTQTLDSPPRIVVDIFNPVQSFESMTIPVKSLNLKSVRIGSHQKKIRLVLEIKGANVPVFTTMSDDTGLTIFLGSKEPLDMGKGKSDQIRQNQTEIEAPPSLPATARQERAGGRQGTSDQKTSSPPREIPSVEKTIHVNPDDGRDDTALLLNGHNAYRTLDWSGAVENLNRLIKTYPKGRYAESAYFLLAKSYEQLYSDSLLAYFTKIKGHYEDAINRYPTSIHVPEALLSIGNLSFKGGNYYEALGYYNFIFKKHKGSIWALKAFMQKAKILLLQKKKGEALNIFEYVVRRYPDTPEERDAKMAIAIILYEMNSFPKSLNILSEMRTTNPESIYQYPKISLYLGYNYEQLGDNVRARENLFQFYNIYADNEKNHMILTKIADTYRDDGLVGDATKLYRLVLERYLDTEGAVISRIRLAEQQEEGELRIKRGIGSPFSVIDKVIGLPREIYEDVMNNLFSKDKENPLAQLALLRLAIVYQKEKNYDKSLKALKDFLEKYPFTSLKKESRHALLKTASAILKEELKRKRYINVVNIYRREEELFLMFNAPDPFLTVARAFFHLNLPSVATEMFQRADPLLQDNEKPSDLLYFVSLDLFKKQRFKEALARITLLIDKYPTHKYASDAYHLKGKILFRQKRYPQAIEMFSSVLGFGLSRCNKAGVLIDKARALMDGNFKEKALTATREAYNLKRDCDVFDQHIYEKLGDLYLHLGYAQEAIPLFNDALNLEEEEEEENKILLKLKMAKGYGLLDKKEDYVALYDQISSLNDPFWSNVSKEKLEELKFNSQLKKQAKNRKKE